jgi:hypothetical protein
MCSERVLLAVLLSLAAAVLPAQGKVLLSTDEALALAFPEATMTRRVHALSVKLQQAISERAGVPCERATVFAYEARRGDELLGVAYFDNHRVRSLNEVLMIAVGGDHKVHRVEVLAFGEPIDYLPRDVFYAQFVGRPLDAELSLRRAIRPVTGATLSVQAATDAVRRVLATHRELYPAPPTEPAAEPTVEQPKPEKQAKPAPQPDGKPIAESQPKSRPQPEPKPVPPPAPR